MTALAFALAQRATIPADPAGPGLPAWFPSALRQASRSLTLAAGQRLFETGGPVRACYRVVTGGVSLLRPGPASAQALVQRAADGEWLVEPDPHDKVVTCLAVAQRATILCAVPARAFRKALREDAGFAVAWMRETARTARRLQRAVERLSMSRASDRIVHYLATESDAGSCELELTFPLCEWARRLGVSGETLSRTLADMQAHGSVLRCGRRMFRLLR